MKRRKFIKYGALGGSGLIVLPSCKGRANEGSQPLAQGQKPKASTKEKLGIALVGLGSYSTYQLAPALQKTKHCYLAGIVTGSSRKVPDWQKKYGIKDSNVYTYDNMHEIADNDEIDIIYIVVPTGVHAKYATIAANAGKHVFCEKPMAMNVKECEAIIKACDDNNVRLAIGYRMLHETNTKELISYATSKPFGEISHVEAHACYAGGGGVGKGWRFERDMGGGAMYDMGVYTVNGIRYASGMNITKVIEASQVMAGGLKDGVDETTRYKVELSNGLVADGLTSINNPSNHLRVTCENGSYQVSPMQSYNGVVGDRSDGVKLDAFVDSQQALQMDDDALAIIEGRPLIAPGIEGLKDIRVIEAIFKSAATNQSVDI